MTPKVAHSLFDWFQTPQGQRWICRGFVCLAVVGLVVYSQRDGDFIGYVQVGNLLLDGQNIYDTPLNTWPPFFSLVCVPLALLDALNPYLAHGIWILLNYGCFLVVLCVMARLVYQRPFSLGYKPNHLSLAAPELFVPVLLTSFYIASNFEHLQINLILFCLTLLGLYLQATQREFAGSVAIGCAAAMKVMPAALIPYLVYRGRFKAALYTTLATALFSLSPVAVWGWPQFWQYMETWRGALRMGWSVGKMNQSVYAMLDRFAGHHLMPLTSPGVDGLPASGAPIVTLLWLAAVLIALGLSIALFRGQASPHSPTTLAEWSVVLIVAAVFGTVSWKAYLVVLLLPNAVLYKAWRSPASDRHTRRVCGTLLILAFVIGSAHSRDLVGRDLSGRLEMSSCVTLAALLLLGGVFWYRHQLAKQPQT